MRHFRPATGFTRRRLVAAGRKCGAKAALCRGQPANTAVWQTIASSRCHLAVSLRSYQHPVHPSSPPSIQIASNPGPIPATAEIVALRVRQDGRRSSAWIITPTKNDQPHHRAAVSIRLAAKRRRIHHLRPGPVTTHGARSTARRSGFASRQGRRRTQQSHSAAVVHCFYQNRRWRIISRTIMAGL